MSKVDFYLVSDDYEGFETPRACSIVAEVGIPCFSRKGVLVKISPPIIGQLYGFGGNDIHSVILTPRFDGVFLSAIREWPCHVHILCVPSSATGETSFDCNEIVHLACGEIYPTINAHTAPISAGIRDAK